MEKRFKRKNEMGITIIALVITIIVMMVLVGVSLNATIGENGIITKALIANFTNEMTQVRENLDMELVAYQLDNYLENTGELFTTEITKEIADKFDKTLIYEIAYYRSLYGCFSITTEMNIDELNSTYVYKFYKNNPDAFIDDVFYISEDIGNRKKETYIYDAKVDIIYKIVNTRLAGKVAHSLEYLNYLLTSIGAEVKLPDLMEIEGSFVSINGIKYYSPNYKNFTLEGTYAVYFDKTDLTDIEKIVKIPLKEFTGEREITKNGNQYILYDYENKIWANIVTTHASKEAWWVWLPRYSYGTIDKDNFTNIDITFVDTNTAAHPAFTVDGKELQGIWVSKYEPILSLATESNMLSYYLPDMSGFKEDETYLEIYDSATGTFNREVKLSEIGTTLKKFSNENLWFNYDQKIWANIKTVSNGIESWWVWVPRYAYSIVGNQTDIKFIDIYNNPVDGNELGSNYTIHSAFTITNDDGTLTEIKGIWVSKYEPGLVEGAMIEQNVNIPNLEGYNVNTTWIEVYNETGTSLLGEIELSKVVDASNVSGNKLTGVLSQTKLQNEINALGNGATWYNYNQKVWANIKTENNGDTAYWTWVPRYSYSIIGNQTNVVFTNIANESLTGGVEITANMIPHPGFTITSSDGSKKELEGIWVSKYEPIGNTSNILNVVDGETGVPLNIE